MIIRHRGFGLSICIAALVLQAGPTLAQAARGRILFLRCASCHDISTSSSPKIGPNLYHVYGRRAGSLPGFAYSPAMKAQTIVWDEKTLDLWLKKPSDLVPETAMAFAGLPNKADRAAVIAYLRKPGR